MRGRIIIGTRRYSSWSLRGWLPVRLAGLDVEEVAMPLAGGYTASIHMISPGGTVPVLEHDGSLIWESLAIGEYCAELKLGLWPADRAARALARSVSSEMHAGFRALRQAMPMSLFRSAAGAGRTPDVLADIARIEAIWHDCRSRFGAAGPYLFGAGLTVADAMYAPVVCRFLTYQPELGAASRAYCDAVRAHPLLQEWYRAAAAEPESWRVAAAEAPL